MIPKINSSHGAETRNIINRVIEVLNQQGKSLQDLVAEGQLTPSQYAELITVINGLIKSGHVDKNDLTPEFKDEIEGFDTQLAQTPTKEEVYLKRHGININDLDESTRQAFLEAQGVDVNYVLGKENVTPINTTFLKPYNNLYNGVDFVRKTISGLDPFRFVSSESERTAVIPIKPNTTYSIIREPSSRFKIGTDTILNRPELEDWNGSIHATLGAEGSLWYTITSGANDVVLYVNYTNTDEETLLQVVEGELSSFTIDDYSYTPTNNIEIYNKKEVDDNIKNVIVEPENTTFLKRDKSINLYNGDDFVRKTLTSTEPNFRLVSNESNKTAVIHIKPNTTYSIIREVSSRFKIATDTLLNRQSSEVLQGSIQHTISGAQGVLHYTITSGENDVVLYVNYTNTDEDTLLQVVEGEQTEFTVSGYDNYRPNGIYVYGKDEVYNKKEIDRLNVGGGERPLVVEKTGVNLDIYVPSPKSNRYVHYPYHHIVDSSINLEQWRVPHVNVVDESFNLIYTMNTGDWEGVVTETGADDAIGGVHGDETNVDINILIDGQEVDINGDDFTMYPTQEIKITNNSILNRCDTPGDDVVERSRVNAWTPSETIVDNKFKFIQPMTVDRITMTFFAVGYEYVDRARNDGDYKTYIIPEETPSTGNDIREMELWGTESGLYVKAVADNYEYGEGGYQAFVDFTNRSKLYFRTHLYTTFEEGAIVKGRSRYTIMA